MRWMRLALVLLVTSVAVAASKPHVITFGKWTSVQISVPGAGEKQEAIRVRALIVDGKTKEFVTGAPHEVTDRLFVMRRAYRINDSLPDESSVRWQWQVAGWLMVDRVSGRVSSVNLPEFDPVYSEANWYRDYAAYCGMSEDGRKVYAVVARLGSRKPVLKKQIGSELSEVTAEPVCHAPVWQRKPIRVSFEPAHGDKVTYAIRGRMVDVVEDEEEE